MRCYTEIDGIQVDSKVFTAMFACDYEKCKGACCNQPIHDVELNGGELTDCEAAEILYNKDEIASLCYGYAASLVRERPVYKDGETFYTRVFEDKCVLCNMKRGTCALKLAKDKGICGVDIPLSCQLYPILWEAFPTYERLSVGDIFDKDYCVHGYAKGKREKVYLLDFVKDALIRAFGEDFYTKLKEVQKEFI